MLRHEKSVVSHDHPRICCVVVTQARGRIPARTSIHIRQKENLTHELNHCTGQGVVETFCPR
jgi:hypothetical protein